MQDIQIYQITILPVKIIASYGVGSQIPHMHAIYPGYDQPQVAQDIEGFEYEQTYRYLQKLMKKYDLTTIE